VDRFDSLSTKLSASADTVDWPEIATDTILSATANGLDTEDVADTDAPENLDIPPFTEPEDDAPASAEDS
jgi:hypothetical protein